ncbi:hypothetical protein B0H15DRAFT_818277 [Mycena belliarum]|uniref:Secreted protein n=1 Tax=Mycena belliarum TaxID=1033014 RepID=A0AAD6UDM0_9AGAR|nr:hypothetical protein B0H15DRAFT_818277 [Mycena belliae]
MHFPPSLFPVFLLLSLCTRSLCPARLLSLLPFDLYPLPPLHSLPQLCSLPHCGHCRDPLMHECGLCIWCVFPFSLIPGSCSTSRPNSARALQHVTSAFNANGAPLDALWACSTRRWCGSGILVFLPPHSVLVSLRQTLQCNKLVPRSL